MINRIVFTTLVGFFSLVSGDVTSSNFKKITYNEKIEIVDSRTNSNEEKPNLYSLISKNSFSLPTFEIFNRAIEGYNKLVEKGKVKNKLITIIDFNLPSNQERLWIVDMERFEVIHQSLVAHGRNSGDLMANSFSNEGESYKSSLGFYLTGETYNGKHGLSLKLDGLESRKNDKARERAIVIHGADYVSNNFLSSHNRLGRSHGCPAIPMETTTKIIKLIKNKSVLFIDHKQNNGINI
jgi:hypothetical protein